MKVILFSTDKDILKESSEPRRRMLDYGRLIEELHIIVFSKQNFQFSIFKYQISKNIQVYPTNSRFKFLCFFDAYKIARKILMANGQWLITTQDPFETGLVGYLLKRKFKIPLQIQIHTDFLSPYFWQESLKNKIRVILGKWLFRKANGVRVVSERIKKSLVASGYTLNPIYVLPIFVDTDKIKNSSVRVDLHEKYPGRFIILMASRLTREKNIGLAIKVMAKIAKEYPKVLLVIVGSGPEENNLRLQVTSYKLQDFAVFEPWTDDLASYYKTADLFLLTSNYEGYGRTVVEAAAAGLPAVMTDVGVAIGSVVPIGDIDVLASCLKRIVENKSARDEILKNQKMVLDFYRSKDDFLSRIKQSWQSCFSPQ